MTETGDLADTSSVEEVNSVPTPDAEEKQAGPVVPKYVCPQRRSKLNPLAEPFHPGSNPPTACSRPSIIPPRVRRKPTWQTTGNWIT